MKPFLAFIVLLLAFQAPAHAAPLNRVGPDALKSVLPAKPRAATQAPTPADGPAIAAGGETFASATTIPSLPYTDSGTTIGRVNDYEPPCAQTGAPDVVYKFTPSVNTCVTISLCGSTYDTALLLYENNVGNLKACNDDFCGSSPQQSKLRSVSLTAGRTYYIVVDGYGCDEVDCSEGAYTLSVTTDCPPPCVVPCPPSSIVEGEPTTCNDDGTNDGCNMVVPGFTDIPCSSVGITICGAYGSKGDGSVRDSDWYRLVLAENSRVTFCGTGEATTIMNIVDFSGGCQGLIVLEADAFEPCIPGCMERVLPAGTYMLVVSSLFAADVACGKKYTLSVQCEAGAVGVEDEVPVALAIGPPFPNPARGQVVFGIDLPRASEVDASIHDLTGRRIATIVSGALGEGRHQLRWSGVGTDGGPVSSGVFYLRLSAGGETQSRAFVVTR